MPVPRKEINTQAFGRVEIQIINILQDGQGYHASELLEVIGCNKNYLHRCLGNLQKGLMIRSKLLQKKETRERKVYFLSDHLLPENKRN